MKNTIKPFSKSPYCIFLPFLLLICLSGPLQAHVVTDLEATFRNGQVFLTWTNPNSSAKLQYNVYRSSTKITESSQLTSGNLLGFVRENSSKDLFWSQQEGTDYYYRISDLGTALLSSQGLYVATSISDASWYYAVTVTTVSGGTEDKNITVGENSLKEAVAEAIEQPLPVLQDSVVLKSGEVRYHYVLFGDNQETDLFPAINSVGSWGFDFFMGKRGSASLYPLFVLYEGTGGDPLAGFSLDDSIDDCYLIGVNDWLPVPKANGDVGENTYFTGYHEDFNIYVKSNPIPTKGIVKAYIQHRIIEAIEFMQTHFPIDTTRTYLKGTSANGFGALMTAGIIPEKIAAVYASVQPIALNAVTDTYKEMWGEGPTKLKSDINQWDTGEPLTFNKLTDLDKLMSINAGRNMPVIYDVHGKNDGTVGWDDGKVAWLDTLNNCRIGSTFFWDQRDHDGSGKNFNSEETLPDFYRFATNKSFPAFSNCSINHDPGNGNKKNGDDYGAINGYLDFDDDNIEDNTCNYTVHVFVKDFYVGGILDAEQYNSCTADITLRRLQNFHPAPGVTLKWKNLDEVTGDKIQSGEFVYDGGLITLSGLTLNKSGNEIFVKVKGCSAKEGVEEADPGPESYTVSPTAEGYRIGVFAGQEETIRVALYDLAGRLMHSGIVALTSGSNSFDVEKMTGGLFLLRVEGASVNFCTKLLF